MSDFIITAALSAGDRFVYRGEVATFIEWDNASFMRNVVSHHFATVLTNDGIVRWSIACTGTVPIAA